MKALSQVRAYYLSTSATLSLTSRTGFNSYVARLPADTIGVAVLTNDEQFGSMFADVIKYRIIDQALALPPLDVNSITKNAVRNAVASRVPTPRPADASSPSVEFASLAGTYENPGYGQFELCYASGNSSQASEGCQSLLANATTILPGVINASIPTYVVRWDRVFGDFFTLTHFNADVFNMSIVASFPTGNDTVPFWTTRRAGSVATFAADDQGSGFGVAGGLWGAGAGVPDPAGNSVRERSEVWFGKV
ncbi:hypothetical protein HGRIS_005887 [Hohenbuehelia grisea]|uniref:Beta-lactamase-related domain-containing protein n=1 Tax=Hohenbuehelia grisea TaxID=104357 RepID=A0ABR3K0I5_9AGAR